MDIRSGNFANLEFSEIPGSTTYSFVDSVQQYRVPLGVSRVKITAVGGSGANAGESFGGLGANVSTVANVTPLSTLYVVTGSSGVNKPSGDVANAGVRGYFYTESTGFVYGGNGGGYSGVYSNSNLNITTALLIAGGGGGAGGITGYSSIANGGNAGLYGSGSGENGYGQLSNITYRGRTDSLSNGLAQANMVYFIGPVGNHTLNMSVVSTATMILQTGIQSVASNPTGASNVYINSFSYTSNGGFARAGTTTGTSAGGGGGGAGGVGSSAGSSNNGGNGGIGRQSNITGTLTYYAGGGGGGGVNSGGNGGLGGGGNGSVNTTAQSGSTNTGGGGGGAGTQAVGGAGGSGIVIVRYPSSDITATGGTITTITVNSVEYKVHTFTANGTFAITNSTYGAIVEYLVVGGGGGGGGRAGVSVFGCGGGGAGEYREGNFSVFTNQNYAVTIGAGGLAGNNATGGGTGGDSSILTGNGSILILATGGGGGGYFNVQGTSNTGSGGGGGGRESTPPGYAIIAPNINVSASFSVFSSGDSLTLPSNCFGTSNASVTNVSLGMNTATITSRAGNGAITLTDNITASKRYGDGGNIISTTASRGVQSNVGLTIVNQASNGSATTAGWGAQVSGNGVLDGAGGGGGGSGYRSGGGGASGDVSQVGGGGGGSSWSAGDIIWNGYNSANANGYVRFDVVETRTSFSYTGLPQKFIVPSGATALRITAVGAKGGTAISNSTVGGNGANLTTTLLVGPGNAITAGSILTVVVGGSPGANSTAQYGYAGNGGVQANTSRNGSAGGGLSGVFTNAIPSVNSALIVAGGGGGAMSASTLGNGGASGTIYVGDGSNGSPSSGSFPSTVGRGGRTSTTSGGSAGTPSTTQTTNPTSGTGINGGNGGVGNLSTSFGGGGGGAGWYGGGGGAGGAQGGGGGGGSSYSINPASYGTVNSANGSHGSVIIDTIFGGNNTVTYNYTGNMQVYVPPAGATKILVNAVGASGANGRPVGYSTVQSCSGGGGANITAIVDVTAGIPYYVVVGGTSFNSNVAAYGFGGDGGYTGEPAKNTYNVGGAGGGLSGIFTTSTPSYANALIIAGGGGGGGSATTSGGATNRGGNAASSGAGNGSNGGEDSVSSFGRNAGEGGSITTATAGAAGNVVDTNTTNPTAGSGINGGSGGIHTSILWNSGGGGGAGAFGGGGGAVGGDASGGGGAGATFFGNNTTSIQTYGSLNYGHGFVTITVVG